MAMPAPSQTRRWNIVETHAVLAQKTADGAKLVNNYVLLRTLGQGRFAKVKLCERTPAPSLVAQTPATPHAHACVTSGSDEGLGPPPPRPTTPVVALAFQPPPGRRQFAMKIFSKKSLLKMKDYVTHRQVNEAPQNDVVSVPKTQVAQTSVASTSSRMRVVTALDRVHEEVRIMRSLYHRNIVLLFEVIESDEHDKIYMVQEYMPSGPCMIFSPGTQTFCSPLTHTVLTDELARAHLLDVLHGVAYLHQRGICHRDLKPDNILLNATGRCHITDFGCALECAVDSRGSRTKPLVADTVGTYQFLAPECCSSGEPFDPFKVDVWAIGVLLYIFLFGTLPFKAEGTKELFDEITRGEVVEPTDARMIRPECRDLLLRLLAKRPSERISVNDALTHPWLTRDGDGDEEPPSF